jgi:hypothetical protein
MLNEDRGGDRHAVGNSRAKTVIKEDRYVDLASQERGGEEKEQQ